MPGGGRRPLEARALDLGDVEREAPLLSEPRAERHVVPYGCVTAGERHIADADAGPGRPLRR
jgi:hypothetical protein